MEVSLSHDNRICLCVAGEGPQGCDIEPVVHRTREDWMALLGSSREPLMLKLLEAAESVDRAGTRIWTAIEALRKATNADDINLAISRHEDSSVLFHGGPSTNPLDILTFPMTLTRGPERMVAMVVQSAGLAPREAARLRDYGYDPSIYRMAVTDDQAQGQKFFTYRFPLTFKESANLSRNVYFSNYFLWIGKVRELAMWPIFERLAHQCASGEWGMVTNHSQTKILAEAKLNDVIEGHLWLGNVSGTTGSTLDLHYDWYRVLPNDELELLALSELRTTWVRIVDHGVVEAQPFPDYFQEFVNERLTRYNPPEELQPLIEADLGSELYRAPTGPLAASRLAKQVFETTLEDANLVGNIYFSNYAVWQGRVRDRFLYQLVPNLYHGMNTQGELLCRTSRIEHLREAMPFDNIEVTMSPRTVHEHGVRLFFEYFRLTPDNARQKLAFGEHDAVWMKRGTGDRLVPAPLPREILDAISPTSELPTTYAAGQNGPRQNPNAFRRFFRRFGQKASTD